MHINENHLGRPLSPKEQQHLLGCSQCNDQHQNLLSLREQGANIELLAPPAQVWLNIANRHQPKLQKRPKNFHLVGLAASILFTILGFLMFNNYRLQQQVEQVLQVNQSLEIQLIQNSIPSFQQAKMLSQVQGIEQQLILAETQQEKLRLLKLRKKAVTKLVQSQTKGDTHVFKI